MTIEIVGEKRVGDSEINFDGKASVTISDRYEFLVYSSNRFASRSEILAADGLPFVGFTRTETGATCVSIEATRREDNSHYWDVACEFRTEEENYEADQERPSRNPLTWIPLAKVRFSRSQSNAQWITNSAGTKIGEPQTAVLDVPCVEFTQFESPYLTSLQLAERNGAINADIFNLALDITRGTIPERFMSEVIAAQRGRWYGYECWRVRYRVTYYRDSVNMPGKLSILDAGPVYLDPAKGLVTFKKRGQPYIGKLIAGGDKMPDDRVANGDSEYREFFISPRIAFNPWVKAKLK